MVPTHETAPCFGALMALMGIAPLSAWDRSTFKTLGRLAVETFHSTIVTLAAMIILGFAIWIAWSDLRWWHS